MKEQKRYYDCHIHGVQVGENCPKCVVHAYVSVSGEPPRAEPPTKIKMGFLIRVEMHTKDAETAITSPEALRFQIGHMMDSWGIQEEVDYTLEVSRTYENE